MTFTITVNNTGDSSLSNVAVSDPSFPACARTIGALAIGATTSYQCSVTAGSDDFSNVALVHADTPAGTTVDDHSTANVDVIHPSFTVTKGPATQTVVAGTAPTFAITVKNTGDVVLTNIAVSDAQAPGCASQIASLAVNASTTYSCTGPATSTSA